MAKKILVVLGHPCSKSFCNALAESYACGAEESGADVKIVKIGEMKFDPNLKQGYSKIQKLEPDLKKAQKDFKWAEHIVFVYPVWWSTMPALMKGFFDRMFLPGFAYRFKKDSMASWDKLLKGRSARLILTLGGPSFVYKFIYGAPGIKEIKSGILGFSGIKPVKTTMFGGVESASEKKRKKWLEQAKSLGNSQI